MADYLHLDTGDATPPSALLRPSARSAFAPLLEGKADVEWAGFYEYTALV
jgi:hypothetical protein